MRVGDVIVKDRPYVTFDATTPAREVVQKVAGSAWQDMFPVLSPEGSVIGVVSSEILRSCSTIRES